jgi:hypothetical protein
MALYRLLLLDEVGRVQGQAVIDRANDEIALEEAGESDHPLGIEIWQAERLVANLAPLAYVDVRRDLRDQRLWQAKPVDQRLTSAAE